MTAVQWLIQQIEDGKIEIIYSDKIHSIKCLPEFIKQANEMFEKQIIETWHNGYNNQSPMIDQENCGQQYYNETYKKDNI